MQCLGATQLAFPWALPTRSVSPACPPARLVSHGARKHLLLFIFQRVDPSQLWVLS